MITLIALAYRSNRCGRPPRLCGHRASGSFEKFTALTTTKGAGPTGPSELRALLPDRQ
jgi:hypothetical protein